MINQSRESTRSRLIGAAMELFATKGYASTSIADILAAAGARSGSLYYFFPGKQHLLVAALDTYREGIYPMLLEPAWRDIEDPVERVFALLSRYRNLLEATDCLYGCPIGSLALEIHEPDPPVRERLEANFTAWTKAVESCFRAAAARFPPGTDFGRLARFTLTIMEGGVMLSRTYRSLDPFDAAVLELRRHVEGLLERQRSESERQPPKGRTKR